MRVLGRLLALQAMCLTMISPVQTFMLSPPALLQRPYVQARSSLLLRGGSMCEGSDLNPAAATPQTVCDGTAKFTGSVSLSCYTIAAPVHDESPGLKFLETSCAHSPRVISAIAGTHMGCRSSLQLISEGRAHQADHQRSYGRQHPPPLVSDAFAVRSPMLTKLALSTGVGDLGLKVLPDDVSTCLVGPGLPRSLLPFWLPLTCVMGQSRGCSRPCALPLQDARQMKPWFRCKRLSLQGAQVSCLAYPCAVLSGADIA